MTKGAELDKQIYKEGEPTWGCKSGVLDVEDVKEFIGNSERRIKEVISMEWGKGMKYILKEIEEIYKEEFGEELTK